MAIGALPATGAEVWAYVDQQGVAHLSRDRQDERYQLFFRGGEGFDTAGGLQKVGLQPAGAAPAGPVPAASSRLIASFEVSPGYKQVKRHLREASDLHGIDYELLKALIVTESGFDAHAVSPKGAVGLMQLMPATAQRYGVAADRKTPVEKKLTDPKTNIRAGTRYLSYLMALFPGKLELALAAYNAGEGAVQRAGNRIPNYRETQNYVRTVMHLYSMLKPPPLSAAKLGPGNRRLPSRVRMEMSMGNRPAQTAPAGAAQSGSAPAGAGQPRTALPADVKPSSLAQAGNGQSGRTPASDLKDAVPAAVLASDLHTERD